MYTAKIENAKGEILELTHNLNFTVTSIEGLDPVNAIINTSPVGDMDGETYNSSRLGKRNIVINLVIERNVEKNRLMLFKHAPTGQPLRFYYKNSSRDVYIDGQVETLSVGRYDQKESVQISILCPLPMFKSVTEEMTIFSAIKSLFEFDFEITDEGIEIAEYEDSLEKNIVNNSEYKCGIIVELQSMGQVVNPKICNQTNGEQFQLNFTMIQGDIIRINTNTGEKSVNLIRNGEKFNMINKGTFNNKWIVLEPGDNLLAYNCMSGEENLTVTVEKREIFGGV